MMHTSSVIGIDLGGTQIRGGIVKEKSLTALQETKVTATGTQEEVLSELFRLTDQIMTEEIKAIGIGVPSVVDEARGIVYDVQNIPSWKEVPLKSLMEERYHIPVWVNNDANCFALGEKYFGEGKSCHSFIGLTIGTGLGAGIIIHDKLYAGPNCGAGEFGMVNYLDQYYEYYASGQFFKKIYQQEGETVFNLAKEGDPAALKCFEEFGVHLGNAMKMILYTYDPERVILGGSISQAYPYFQKTLWETLQSYAYSKSLDGFQIKVSTLKNCGLLGAAALWYDRS